ncbi:MAG: hypothetical protein P8Z79_21725 [Sedimentisphaerales bacterium]
MKQTEYNKKVFFYYEVDRIRKSPQQAPTEIPMNLWMQTRIPDQLLTRGIEHTREFVS